MTDFRCGSLLDGISGSGNGGLAYLTIIYGAFGRVGVIAGAGADNCSICGASNDLIGGTSDGSSGGVGDSGSGKEGGVY